MAKAAEVAARRVLADAALPSFELLRASVTLQGTRVETVGSHQVKEEVGNFSKTTFVPAAFRISPVSPEEWNRIKKSLREWAQSI